MKKELLTYDEKSFIINGERVFLYGGEMHYFRVPGELWEDRLMKMQRAGANFVSIYIPWNWHEQEEGKYLWDGDRDLKRFLQLCKKYNLYVALKPGPYICAEWDNGGFPDWLLPKRLKLRLFDDKYLKHIKKWFTEVGRVIKPYLFTNGGNVILIQVENEYDHLIEQQREIIISQQDAKKYLMKLLQYVREAGIDILPFTNEGGFIQGTEIIETRTFYPNIPWLWMWEFNDFDKKIELSKKGQPGKPVCIFELQAGWFGQFGKPIFNVPAELTDAIMRNVLVKDGASLLNLYMFVGGTTFPYWGCRGDARGSGDMKAVGSITSFDFSGAPIHEWGVIGEKFYHFRTMSLFLKQFSDLIVETETFENGTRILKGSDEIRILKKGDVESGGIFNPVYEKIVVLKRANNEKGLILVRNTEDTQKEITIEYKAPGTDEKRNLPQNGCLAIPAYKSYMFPIEFKIPDTNYVIEQATSELLIVKNLGDKTIAVLYGTDGLKGETIIRGITSKDIEVKGDIKYEVNNSKLILSYIHKNVQMIKSGNLILIITDILTAGKIWDENELLIISELDFIENVDISSDCVSIKAQAIDDSINHNIIFSSKILKSIIVDGKKVGFNQDKIFPFVSFDMNIEKNNPVHVKWEDNWHVIPDSMEKEIDYIDNNWLVLKKPVSLEEAGLLQHGYFWYRSEFQLLDGIKGITINFNTGGIDRAYVYLNGEFLWQGIGEIELDIEHLTKSKNVLAVRYENAYHVKGHPAEGPIQKYSGLQKPVIVSGRLNNKDWKCEIKSFKVRHGLNGNLKGYEKLNYNDADWLKFTPAKKYVCHQEIGDLVWFRRRFKYNIKENWYAPLGLKINGASERLIIYINGRLIGKYENIGPQDTFYVPEPFLKEDNILALILEGPAFNQFKPSEFKPAFLLEPEFITYKNLKKCEVNLYL